MFIFEPRSPEWRRHATVQLSGFSVRVRGFWKLALAILILTFSWSCSYLTIDGFSGVGSVSFHFGLVALKEHMDQREDQFNTTCHSPTIITRLDLSGSELVQAGLETHVAEGRLQLCCASSKVPTINQKRIKCT